MSDVDAEFLGRDDGWQPKKNGLVRNPGAEYTPHPNRCDGPKYVEAECLGGHRNTGFQGVSGPAFSRSSGATGFA